MTRISPSMVRNAQEALRIQLGDLFLEPDLRVPPGLRTEIAKLDLDRARDFVPLLRGMADEPEILRVVRRLERVLDEEARARWVKAIGKSWARSNRALGIISERWKPPPKPKERAAVPRGSTRWVEQARARKYGLAVKEALAVLEQQDYRCPICQKAFVAPADCCMDHNHDTGAFRAFLCVPCNTGLGLFGDLPDRLVSAAAYLNERGHYGRTAVA